MVEQRGESLTVSLLEEAMPIPRRPSAVRLGSIARHTTRSAIAAVVTTFALCTPALSQTVSEGVLVTYREVATREQVIDATARHAVAQTAAAQTAPGRAPARRRLGRWATIPGALLGAMLGGAVDCLVTRCTAQVPNGVWAGMFSGMAITAFAPRRVAGTYLGALVEVSSLEA